MRRVMIASLSGVRGILNQDLSLEDVGRFAGNFCGEFDHGEILVARDTRGTGPAMCKTVICSALSKGLEVVDYGVASTPALFRESRVRGSPAIMVTASHNEPEFNGLKFVVRGKGITKSMFDVVAGPPKQTPNYAGKVRQAKRTSYVDDLVQRFGVRSCQGAKVALDLGGGAAALHAPELFAALGCRVMTVNGTPGVFSRRIDPVVDGLVTLRDLVERGRCDIGLGFDCDGDRLVIVDSAGRKRTGDYMLTLAVSELLKETKESKVVVSLDTTQAIDDVAARAGVRVFRTKVGEANVVSGMVEWGARLGGEGSSGGLIDGEFNYCRDSLLAAVVIVRALMRGGLKTYESVPVYQQERVALAIPKAKALRALRTLAAEYPDADTRDGVKIVLQKRSWVLVRPSGTEDAVRVSAEAPTSRGALEIAKEFAGRLAELSR